MLFFGSILKFVKNIGSVEDSVDVPKSNVVGIGNIYLKDYKFLCKMSPYEIFGIGTNIAGETWLNLVNLLLMLE